MKNARDIHGARCRARWAAAMALGAVVVLAPSPAWSQDRGQVALMETPQSKVLSDGSIQEAGSLTLRLQRRATISFIPQKIDGTFIGVFTSLFGTSRGPAVSLRFVILQRNGRGEQDLVSYSGFGGGALGTSILRRVVMTALP